MTLKLLRIFSICSLIIFSSSIYAQGDLMVMPKRLVFDGSQRAQEINLANTGTDSTTYAISIVQYKMTEEGNFVEISDPEENQRFATNFLRYYPRRVTLAPNEAQTVRIQVTRTGDLENGEYRSHIYFRAVEKQVALGEEAKEDSEGISINIKTVFGISIPIIIREGESTTTIDLDDLNLDTSETAPKLSLAIKRSGNMSVYGTLSVKHISPTGTTIEVGLVKGIAVYTPNIKRDFSLNLFQSPEIDYTSGKLLVTYSDENGKLLGKNEFTIK
ncbi:molecular chaperone [Gillisia sp. M10.2A]|uniref:Molecular chaperone n=1 Tax=Gillisia lutea TaxID=2909668 RepID=A0ABS9EIC7_9FLAO|nr:molecular chaperone [Gillisia lutea]MCF4101535.1 molecular chaperone [Gillisia lutea]